MPDSRYIVLAMFLSLVFPTGCGSNWNRSMQDPVARSGTGSEEIWYQYGGARVAYTAIARPKQLYTGYGTVRDPALYAQAPMTTQAKTPPKKPSRAKPAVTPPRDPNCPPCPPADTAKHTPAPQSLLPQTNPVFSAPAQSLAKPTPSPAASAPTVAGTVESLPSVPQTPLSSMPAAIPAPMAPNAPGT